MRRNEQTRSRHPGFKRVGDRLLVYDLGLDDYIELHAAAEDPIEDDEQAPERTEAVKPAMRGGSVRIFPVAPR